MSLWRIFLLALLARRVSLFAGFSTKTTRESWPSRGRRAGVSPPGEEALLFPLRWGSRFIELRGTRYRFLRAVGFEGDTRGVSPLIRNYG